MKETLGEMKSSGEQATQEMHDAIENINWMARSMDWSQKVSKKGIEDSGMQAQKSLEATSSEMQQDRRAWVSISVIPEGQLELRAEVGVLPLRLTMTNVGHSPAEFVKPWAQLALGMESTDTPCDFLREPRVEKEKNGWTLFPGDSFTKSYPAGTTLAGNKLLKEFSPTKPNPFILVSLVVCNDYTLPFDPKIHHQTRQVYAVGRLDPTTHLVMGDFHPLTTYNQITLSMQPGGSAD
jgi:hypothetical protein